MQNYEKENEADFCQENLVELSPIFNSENKLGESLDFFYLIFKNISIQNSHLLLMGHMHFYLNHDLNLKSIFRHLMFRKIFSAQNYSPILKSWSIIQACLTNPQKMTIHYQSTFPQK